MYKKLKNILGASLIILAIVIAQIPMSDAQADSPITVTFNMNGGKYNGEYNDYTFKNQMPVLVLDKNQTISSFPSENAVSYTGYQTEKDTWYMDKECLSKFDKNTKMTQSTTLYKKWYSIDDGFYLNPDKTVLYKYIGSDVYVEIPETVKIIADDAFDKINGVRGISLPTDIEKIEENAFSGVKNQTDIIYIYDAGTEQSKELGEQICDKYEQLVYSEHLDAEEIEKITGINYNLPNDQENETKAQVSSIAATNTVMPIAALETAEESETEKYTVVFDMNGGSFSGQYEGKDYDDAKSLTTEVVEGGSIASNEYPENVSSSEITYKNYNTDTSWYTDEDALTAYSRSSEVEEDITLYKKWYDTQSGFTMNPQDTVLYKYNGSAAKVVIPDTVTAIGTGAFSTVYGISSIQLPENLKKVEDNAFSGVEKLSSKITIIAPEDNETAQDTAKALADKYSNVVYENGQAQENEDDDGESSVSIVSQGTLKVGTDLSEQESTATEETEKKTVTVDNSTAASANSTASQTQQVTRIGDAAQTQNNTTRTAAQTQDNTARTATQTQNNAAQTATQTQNTTERTNVTAASGPRSSEHVLDQTPKTGDPTQYRTLLVIGLFSMGVLLILTGNGNRKKSAAF